jgi:hypothetical protein
MSDPEGVDPFAHLKQQAAERSERTVERTSAGIAALRKSAQKITAESLKQATRELEPGFAGLSFQVILRTAKPPTPSARQLQTTSSRAPNGAVDGVFAAPPAERHARRTTHSSAWTKRSSFSGFAHLKWNSTPSARHAVLYPTISRQYWPGSSGWRPRSSSSRAIDRDPTGLRNQLRSNLVIRSGGWRGAV